MAQTQQKPSGASTLAAGIAGAAVGAAAAVILTDKSKRDKIAGAVSDLRMKGEELSEQVSQKMDEVRGKVESKIDQAEEKARQEAKKIDKPTSKKV